MDHYFEIINLCKSFGGTTVLSEINLVLEKGKVYTIIGNNGSGKTTLFNIISGYIKPSKGNIFFQGKCITNLIPFKISQLGITRTFQDLRLATKMTVRENIQLGLEKKTFFFSTLSHTERIDEILSMISLQNKANDLAGEISYGQQKLLTLGCCLANNSELILLDEPIAGIDRDKQLKIKQLVIHLRQQGTTILQIEHNHSYIESTSDHIIQLKKGCILCY